MKDWIDEVLEEMDLDIKLKKAESFKSIMSKQEKGMIAVDKATLLAALEHDKQTVEAITQSLEMSMGRAMSIEGIRDRSDIVDMVNGLFTAAMTIANRNPTTTILIRRILESVQDHDSEGGGGRRSGQVQ